MSIMWAKAPDLNEPGYGIPRFFLADRCFNSQSMREFNRGLITADELVTVDCALIEMTEIEREQAEEAAASLDSGHQIMAIVIRPAMDIDWYMENRTDFVFCGYDLVELPCTISAITNCGAGFELAIDYGSLNRFGLIDTYRQTVLTQLELAEKYPDESHAWCEIVEVWRKVR